MKQFIIGIKVFALMTVITGIIYPLLITGAAQLIFPEKANGSLIMNNGKVIGSELIGQKFVSPEFFWGRPSAIDYNPFPSGASNLNPIGNKLKEQVQLRIDTIRKYHGNLPIKSIPKDLLFASASGVDPHISPEAAYFQVERISKFRNYKANQKAKLLKIIESSIESDDLFIGGQKRVNVLNLNRKLFNY